MTSNDVTGHRFYADLATWWPLVSAPAEYATGRNRSSAVCITTRCVAGGGTSPAGSRTCTR